MRGSYVEFVEVETRAYLPAAPVVGKIYCIVDEGIMVINHGSRVTEYPSLRFTDLPGVLPVAKGGTGAGTAEGALASLGAVSVNGNVESANRLRTPRKISLSGVALGEVAFDGSGDVAITVTPGEGMERTDCKATEVAPAAWATDKRYPSEKAVRTELDKKADWSEAMGLFRGIFDTPAQLRTSHPIDVDGAYATVLSTNTTWRCNNNEWTDTGVLGGTSVQSVNGLNGPNIHLTPADVGAEPALPPGIRAGLEGNAALAGENPVVTSRDLMEAIGAIPPVPNASTERAGIVQLATAAEVSVGTDAQKAVTSSALPGLFETYGGNAIFSAYDNSQIGFKTITFAPEGVDSRFISPEEGKTPYWLLYGDAGIQIYSVLTYGYNTSLIQMATMIYPELRYFTRMHHPYTEDLTVWEGWQELASKRDVPGLYIEGVNEAAADSKNIFLNPPHDLWGFRDVYFPPVGTSGVPDIYTNPESGQTPMWVLEGHAAYQHYSVLTWGNKDSGRATQIAVCSNSNPVRVFIRTLFDVWKPWREISLLAL